jgi:hypothetical protein
MNGRSNYVLPICFSSLEYQAYTFLRLVYTVVVLMPVAKFITVVPVVANVTSRLVTEALKSLKIISFIYITPSLLCSRLIRSRQHDSCTRLLHMHTMAVAHAHRGSCTCTPRQLHMHTAAAAYVHRSSCTCTPRQLHMHTAAAAHAHRGSCTCTPRQLHMHTAAA